MTGKRRKAVVYLPPDYSFERKYPVLYLLHGIGGNEWERSAYVHADTIVDNLVAGAKAAQMIVVMPNGHALAENRVQRDTPLPLFGGASEQNIKIYREGSAVWEVDSSR